MTTDEILLIIKRQINHSQSDEAKEALRVVQKEIETKVRSAMAKPQTKSGKCAICRESVAQLRQGYCFACFDRYID